MKRVGALWPEITSFANLYQGYCKARKGKRDRPQVADFSLNLEVELFALQQSLMDGSYLPGDYRQFMIRDRKPRVISAAPFRDRVVHHALMNVLEPIFDRSFIYDSYACRKGKGGHRAVDRYQAYAQNYLYVLKLDIRRYFPSIDHHILKSQLATNIKDKQVLRLLDLIVDGSPEVKPEPCYFSGDGLFSQHARRHGIPIGNLTSQIFANLYLNNFDHWLKEKMRVKAYIRYVDDMLLLGNDKAEIWALRDAIEMKLAELRLQIHPTKAHIFRTDEKVDVLGYKVSRTRRWLRNDNGFRYARKMRAMADAYGEGRMNFVEITASVHSWIGHAKHGETEGLRNAIFSSIIFKQREQAGG
ncbi:RNA-dependent DNA polymerase [Mariprofundus sp. EBB-1]|uniref:reverse transcriptase/maturase family protein n=1 Tax=Mariprofundus sp. EBB-1 TaxID=2650971 RepID=UPI000EF25639|nr:reverse transcriptase/maturase family protein [Mariprofundus sp. EBB-1]RLL48976.1 RNA-dependent DNA polymerase [Mariprofundus sp. EBB-1]